ncbi:unnamed protein product [Closterium sp. NIES-54]
MYKDWKAENEAKIGMRFGEVKSSVLEHVELPLELSSGSTTTKQSSLVNGGEEAKDAEEEEEEVQQSDYDECAFTFFSPVEILGEPATLQEASESSDAEEWKNAMESELKSIEENGTWELVELPEGRKAITSMWLFKIKSDADSKIERYTSRLVVKGYQQKEKAPRQWYLKLRRVLEEIDFTPSTADHFLFMRGEGEQRSFMVVYVDDILIFSPSSDLVKEVMLKLQDKCKALGDVNFYLGILIERDVEKQCMRVHQRKYLEALAVNFGQSEGHVATPFPSGFKCMKGPEEESVGEEERRRIHSLVAAGMRVAKYLGQTPTVGLQYSAAVQRRQKGADGVEPGRLFLTAFSDASYESQPEDMTSVGGLNFYVGHRSLPRLRGMHSRLLVSGLPRSLPPLQSSPAPPCLPCVEERQRAAPHSSSFPPTTAPLQTFLMDAWGPARVSGQGCERYFLLFVDDYTRYTTIFPLRSKGQLVFSSDLLRVFCRGEGILQSFTLADSPLQNGIAERRIGLVMEVTRTSMIHTATPHFLCPFAVLYAAHQLNLWACVSLQETSPTLRWTGKVGDASVFRFYHPTSCRVFPSQDVTFDRPVPFYCLFPYCSAPPPPPPLFLAPGPPPEDPLSPQGPAPSGVSHVDPLPGTAPVEVAVGSGAAPGAASGGAASWGAELGGTESEGAGSGGAEPGGAELGGAEPGGVELGDAEPEGVELGGAKSEGVEFGGAGPRGIASSRGHAGASPRLSPRPEPLSPQQLREWFARRTCLRSGAAGAGDSAVGDTRAGGAGVTVGAGGTEGATSAGPGGAHTRGTGAARIGGVGGAGAGDPTEPGAARAGGARDGGIGAGGGGAGAVLGVASSTSLLPPLLCPPPDQSQPPLPPASPLPASSPYTKQTGGLTERHEPASHPASPVCTGRRVPPPCPPSVPSTHAMAHRPSSVPLRMTLRAPLESSLPVSTAASALVAELVDFAAACRPDYATALVAESESTSPLSVTSEGALGTDVLEERQEEFECCAAAVPRFLPCGLPAAMDAEMASWKSTGTYVDAVPPSWANRFDGMWNFRVKQPPGSPPVFKACYVARGFSQKQGVDYFQTLSPTLRVLLHVAAQRDYELHSLDFSTAFLQGSLHEEIWLRRPPAFTGLFPAGTQWSLRWPVYGLRQAPREWHDTLRTTLAARGFTPTADPSLFLCTDTSLPPFYILVYVDDLVFATADTEALALVKSELQKRHTCTILGELRSYLRLHITRDRARRTMVHQVLQHFGFRFSSPQPTPLCTGHSLSTPPSDDSVEPSGLYPELVGCLILADPSRGPVLASSSTVLPRPTVPSSSLSGLHLPLFSMNLVSAAALYDSMVTTTTPRGQRVSFCMCTRTGRHLTTFTCRPGSSLYTLTTEPPQVAASSPGVCVRSGSSPLLMLPPVAPDSPVAPLPWSPLPATPAWHALPPPCFWSSQVFASPPALACPALPSLRRGAAARRSSLLLVSPDECSPADYPHGLRLQLRERFHQDLPLLRLHSDRGGEFSSDLLWDFCHGEGILQSFMLTSSPQQNGVTECRIGLVMEVAHTFMVHAAAPHFLWSFAVRYAAHQLNPWPRVSLPETSPTLHWTGEVGVASVFRNITFDESVHFYHLFPYRTAPLPPSLLFLAPGPPQVDPLPPQGPAPSCVSQVDPLPLAEPFEVAINSGVAKGAACGGAASRGAEPVSAEPRGAESEGAEPGRAEFEGAESGGAEPEGAQPRGTEPEGAEPGGAKSEGAESGGGERRGTASAGGAGGFATGGTGAGGAGAASPRGARTSGTGAAGAGGVGGPGAGDLGAGGKGAGDPVAGGTGAGGAGAGGTRGGCAGASSLGGAGVTAGAGGAGGAGATGPGGARTQGTRAAGAGGVGGTGAVDPGAVGIGAGSAGARGAIAGGIGAGGAGAGGAGAGGAGAGGSRAVDPRAGGAGVGGVGAGGPGARGTVQRRPLFVPPPPPSLPPPDSVLRQVLSLPSSTGLPPSLLSPPPQQSQTLLQSDSPLPASSPYAEQTESLLSVVSLSLVLPRLFALFGLVVVFLVRVLLLSPALTLWHFVLPLFHYDPTVPRLLATVVTDPSFESTAASALVAELVDFAAACRLDYATNLVAKSESDCPPFVGGECAFGTDILEDRQEDFECLAGAVPHLVAMLLAPEGDPGRG